MTQMLGDLVQRAAFVEEQRRAGVAEVVAAEVSDAGALERGDPDPAPPVVSAQVAALAVGEHKRARVRPTAREIQLDEFARDRLEEFRLAAALRLRRGDLAAGDGPLHAQALPWAAAIIEHVTPHERVRLGWPKAFVGEDADERGVLRVELSADRLDRFRRARVDRGGSRVRDAADADDGIPSEPTPFHGSMEDALKEAERAVDRRCASPVDAESRCVVVDRLARDLAQAFASEVGDDPLVEERRVRRERVRAQVRGGVGVPPFDEELLERRVRADHLRGELTQLSRAAGGCFEELGVAAAVEGAFAFRASATAFVPADDVDGPAVATPAALDAHLAVTVVARRTSRKHGRDP